MEELILFVYTLLTGFFAGVVYSEIKQFKIDKKYWRKKIKAMEEMREAL